MAEKLWRVEQNYTNGWLLLDEKAVHLTKAEASQVLERAMEQGTNPRDLRAVPDKL
tara:strand:+ start:184 stop:351 length:168 start_codon:yes stop_codon:yes gene_type:complete